MNQELYLIQVVTISNVKVKTKWTKDLNLYPGNRIEIKMPLVATTGSSSGGCYASNIELRNLDEPDVPVKYTTVNIFLNTFPRCYDYSRLY